MKHIETESVKKVLVVVMGEGRKGLTYEAASHVGSSLR
jgi:hypothetical protein